MKKAVLFLSFFLLGCAGPNVSSSTISLPEIDTLHFEMSTCHIEEGESFDLPVTASPSEVDASLLSWSCSDEAVLSLSSGKITAKKAGEAQVRVEDPRNKDVASTCKVTVFPKASTAVSALNPRQLEATVYRPDVKKPVLAYFLDNEKSPYLDIRDYYRLLLNKEMTVTRQGEGHLYELSAATGAKATIDADKDTLVSDDYEWFIDTTIYRQEGVFNTYYDGAPFLRVNHSDVDKPAKKTTIDFSAYRIKIIPYQEKLLFPLPTLSNMFMGPTMLACLYDRDHLYFIDPNYPDYGTQQVLDDPVYNTNLLAFFPEGKRTSEEAALSYGELCFYVDTYYGASGRETLHDAFVEKRSLDAALLNQDKMTRICRNLLKSIDQVDYYAGLFLLNDYLGDAGHTVINMGVRDLLAREEDLSDKVKARLLEIGYTVGQAAAKRRWDAAYMMGLSSIAKSNPIENLSYLKQGDTVVYRFDAFDFNLHEWNAFYAKKQGMPIDAVGNFFRMLERYKSDESVRNVVLDISSNGGGYADIVFTMMSLMTGKSYLHYRDVISDQIVTTHYDVDRNFDGVFDDKDEALSYPYRFGILTSRYSFSCGNLLPVQAKEQGICILGDTSGGGCCAVLEGCSGEGMCVRISSQVHMVRLDGGEVEDGAKADAFLVTHPSEDTYDFSQYLNLGTLSEKMNAFYAGK